MAVHFDVSQADAARREQQLDNGLIIGHAYSVTDVKVVSISVFHEGADKDSS